MPSISNNPAAATAAAAETGAITKLNADFDMFLRLLTSQMQNQDPLDPMDTSEYTQQLVQYSQVEQSIEQTETLKSILSSLSTQDISRASGLIGREATFDTDRAGLTDEPATWSYASQRTLTALEATVYDANGKAIAKQTIDSPASAGSFIWDGTRTDGSRAAHGTYQVALTGIDSNGSRFSIDPTSTGTVREVRSEDGVLTLGVNGAMLPASALLRIAGA